MPSLFPTFLPQVLDEEPGQVVSLVAISPREFSWEEHKKLKKKKENIFNWKKIVSNPKILAAPKISGKK